MSGQSEPVQVLIDPIMLPAFEAWLADAGLHLYPIPDAREDGSLTTDQSRRIERGDFATYAVGVTG